MKLAVRKEPGHVPMSGFHYMLHPIAMESEAQATIFEVMGHVIIEVDDALGGRLLKQGLAALNHQVEIAFLAEDTLAPRKP